MVLRTGGENMGSDDEFSFSDWLQMELKRQHISPSKLAEMSGVSIQSISHYLHGSRSPSLYNATCILSAFGKRFTVVNQIKYEEVPEDGEVS